MIKIKTKNVRHKKNIRKRGENRRGYEAEPKVRLFKGYPQILFQGAYRFVHRLVAERVLGRRLKKDEVVHHVYGDKMDATKLVICSKSYHRELHRRCLAKHGVWHLPKRSTL